MWRRPMVGLCVSLRRNLHLPPGVKLDYPMPMFDATDDLLTSLLFQATEIILITYSGGPEPLCVVVLGCLPDLCKSQNRDGSNGVGVGLTFTCVTKQQ